MIDTDTLAALMNVVGEVRDRTVRMESRLVQLGDHVGANLRTKQRIEILRDDVTLRHHVVIDSLDVSISRIFTELHQANVRGTTVGVLLDGHLVATLYLP